MTFSLSDAREKYSTWDLDSEITDEIQDWIDKTFENPDNSDLLEFAEYAIYDFTIEKSTLWLDWAINYLWRGRVDNKKISLLEKILTDYEKYKDSGTSRNRAASILGDIAPYPNSTLKNSIVFDDSADESEWNKESIKQFRAAAFGGYIMTATDFQTGIDAGRAIKASGEMPTVEKAEEIIAQWCKEHGKSLPPSP